MNKLRFKGHAEPWEQRKLKDLATLSDGDWIESKDQSPEGIRILQTGNIGEGVFHNKEKHQRFISHEHAEQLKCTKLERGDILISRLPEPAGRSSIIPDNMVGTVTVVDCSIVRDLKHTKNDFLVQVMQSNEYYKQVNVHLSGTTRKRISRKNLENINLPLPSLAEQERIGGFLSALDERLRVQSELVDLLALEYKGYSQRIFSQQLRFKDENGEEYPEWEEKKLGDVADLYQPPTISVSSLKKGKFPVYGATGIIGYHNEYNHEHEQVVISCRGSGCGISNFTQSKSWINGNAMVLNTDNKNNIIDKKFLYHKISNTNFNSSITGTGQPQITRENVKNLVIPMPHLLEQEKIGGFLFSLSARLESEKELLIQLKEQKKAYLQKLFP